VEAETVACSQEQGPDAERAPAPAAELELERARPRQRDGTGVAARDGELIGHLEEEIEAVDGLTRVQLHARAHDVVLERTLAVERDRS
jgi:hypothetical protein